MLTFYYAPNTVSLASHIALEHAGADYRAVRLDFSKEEQRSPEYLRVNPKGRTPALVTPRGILTETPALLGFIARSYPAADLAPFDDAFALAEMESFNAYLCSTVHVAHAHRMRGKRWADDPSALEAMKKKVPQSVGDAFELVERGLRGKWVMGDRYTVSDMYLFTLARWLEADGVDLSRLPRVLEHRRRMAEDPVVKRTVAAELAPG